MKKKTDNHPASKILRSKAEKRHKENHISGNPKSARNVEMIRLNNELSIHQIELEIQNEELMYTKNELEESVEKYVELYEYAPSGYLTIARNKKIIHLNFAASKILGNDKINLINRNFVQFAQGSSKAELGNFLSEIFDTHLNKSCEVVIRADDDRLVNIYLIGHADENGIKCDLNLIDITEGKQAEEKLKRTLEDLKTANEIKSENEKELLKLNRELASALQINSETNRFISILAHDLRSPFSVIVGYSELLCDSLPKLKHDQISKFAGEILNSTRLTFDLLEDLLKWARMQSGRIPFKPSPIRILTIIDEINIILTAEAASKEVTISYTIPELMEIVADRDMLKTILRNLISNSIKYSRPGGFVKVSVEQANSNVLFSVTDNGIGIEPETLNRLFRFPESQTDQTLKEYTGLGLYLCKGFVEKHGGKIWAESIYGTGSFFYFTIPINARNNTEALRIKSPDESVSYDLKVLIVDDNASLSMILGEFMKKYCTEIFFAESGREALDIYRKNKDIDLILMDFYMPDMNGHEVTRQIRKMNNDVKIFIETADTLSNINDEFSDLKIDDYLPKPYNKTRLNELISKHFS